MLVCTINLIFSKTLFSSFDVFFVDWLRERVYFEGLSKEDSYARGRLGYSAPNVFIMDLTS